MVGALVGRTLGTPVGTVAVAVDVSFNTAGDTVNENPRYREGRQARAAATSPLHPSNSLEHIANRHTDTRYCRAEVILKINGPVDIESIHLHDSKEVTDFWK